MARLIQLRRGTKAQHETFTGAVGEVTVVTDDGSLRVHDNATVGGIPIPRAMTYTETASGTLSIEPNSATTITAPISSLNLTFKKSPLESSVYFTCNSDSFSITLTCSDGNTKAKLINTPVEDLSFESGTTYIVSILNGFVAIGTTYPISA